VTGGFLVSLSGSRIGEHLQAGRTCMMGDSKVRSAVALCTEELVWTCSTPEVIGSVLALVCEVDYYSLEWFRLASSSWHVLMSL